MGRNDTIHRVLLLVQWLSHPVTERGDNMNKIDWWAVVYYTILTLVIVAYFVSIPFIAEKYNLKKGEYYIENIERSHRTYIHTEHTYPKIKGNN